MFTLGGGHCGCVCSAEGEGEAATRLITSDEGCDTSGKFLVLSKEIEVIGTSFFGG